MLLQGTLRICLATLPRWRREMCQYSFVCALMLQLLAVFEQRQVGGNHPAQLMHL